jgi:hypothetical protein
MVHRLTVHRLAVHRSAVHMSTGHPTPFAYGWWAVVACVVQNKTTAEGTAFISRLGIWIRCRVELKWSDASANGKWWLNKVSPGHALPYPSMYCNQATPEMAFQPFLGWPACRAGGLWPSSTPLNTPRDKPMD